MEQVQFYDRSNKQWYIVFLEKGWTNEEVADMLFRKGIDTTYWEFDHRIVLFDGDMRAAVGDVYKKVG